MSCSLDSADLSYANLQCACLDRAILCGDTMESTDLRHASFKNAELVGAWLRQSNLQYAHLRGANLRDALLWDANLQHSDLARANFQLSKLGDSYLEDANLYHAVFDTTYLWRVNLENANNIRYIVWGDNIKPRYIIGEEIEAESQPDSIKQESFQRAEITYRDLKTWYEKELLYDISEKFHYRENEVITKASPWIVKILRVLFMKWTYGYGSYPFRLLYYYLPVVIFGFGLIFSLLPLFPILRSFVYLYTSDIDDKREVLTIRRLSLFVECFYFSLLSFGNFGYGNIKPKKLIQLLRSKQPKYQPKCLARVLVVLEAVLGIYFFYRLATVVL